MPTGLTRVAVIGAGHWGPNLIRTFHDRQRSVVTHVVDRDTGRLALLRSRYPDIPMGSDAAEALTASDVDAVIVATPTSTHHALARESLRQGKHVLVEKPMATTVADADELCRLALSAGRVLMVGHVFVYNAGVRWVKEAIGRGDLGALHYISTLRTNLGPIRTDVNAAWDLAAHDLSIVNYWLGCGPQWVSALGGTWINPGVEDAVFATFRYDGGVVVAMHVSWLNPRKVRDIIVVGERRMLTFDDMSLTEPVRVYDKGVSDERTAAVVDTFGSFRASVRDGNITIPRVAAVEPLKAECDHFLECIATGAQPLSGGAEGTAVVRALEAIGRSMRASGREERV